MRLPGLILSFAGILAAVALGSSGLNFVDVPAILFVLLVGGGITATAHGFHATGNVWLALMGRVDRTQIDTIQRTAKTGRQAFVAAGWVGVIIGVVQILGSADDASQIGDGMAVALLTAFYGYILGYLVCLPVERSTFNQNTVLDADPR